MTRTPQPIVAKPMRFKRPLDLAILAVAHVVLFPIWVLLWTIIPLLIKLDDGGPVFFKQARIAKDGRVFSMRKFRTMAVDAAATGPGWTSEQDPRVTRIGRLLRRTALDEIPQLISVWKGDMSFVGPRALPVAMHEGYVAEEPNFGVRLLVHPGLTGLSAIRLPRHCSPTKRLELDVAYIHQASLWLDVRIFVISVWLTLTGRWGKGSRSPEAEPPGTVAA